MTTAARISTRATPASAAHAVRTPRVSSAAGIRARTTDTPAPVTTGRYSWSSPPWSRVNDRWAASSRSWSSAGVASPSIISFGSHTVRRPSAPLVVLEIAASTDSGMGSTASTGASDAVSRSAASTARSRATVRTSAPSGTANATTTRLVVASTTSTMRRRTGRGPQPSSAGATSFTPTPRTVWR